jgi:signal transduction histidine kinase
MACRWGRHAMSDMIDVRQATAAFEELAPTLALDERDVRAGYTPFTDAEVLDRALRHALSRLRYQLNRETFEYLRWKVLVSRVHADAIRAAGTSRRRVPRSSARDDGAAAPPTTGSMYEAFESHDWTVTPLGPASQWSASLRTTAQLVLASGFPQVALWGADLVQIFNDPYRELVGPRHADGFGKPLSECYPDLWHVNAPVYARVLRGETVAERDTVLPILQAEEAKARYFTFSCSPVRDDHGGVGGALLTIVETTAQVEARGQSQELQHLYAQREAERLRLADVFRLAPAFLVVLRGPDLIIELVNDSYLRLVGQEQLVGQSLLAALPELREQGYLTHLQEVLRTGTPFVGREIPVRLNRGRNGEEEVRYLDFVYQPMTEPSGVITGVIAHGTDVTEQVETRRLAEHALEVAETANKVKAQFLSAVSHELRTPLNAIGGYAQLIEMGLRGPVTPEQRHDLAAIQQNQLHLMGLINSLLSFAKVQAGKIEYSLGPVLVSTAVAAVETMVAPQLFAKKLAFTLGASVASNSALAVYADMEKLRQILVNLVGNAIKFTDAGGSISVSAEPNGSNVEIRVSDTGIGIAPGQLGGIFEPFIQVRRPNDTPADGVGLGLAISREMARGMGGDLTAASVVSKGTVMTLTLARA